MNENNPQNFNNVPVDVPGGNPKSKKLLLIIGGTVTTIILVVGGLFLWQMQLSPTPEQQPTQQTPPAPSLQHQTSEDPRASCDKVFVQIDQDAKKETALFCQDGNNPVGFVLLIDTENEQEKEMWRKDLISDLEVGNLRASDVESDGIDELLYEELGATACCGTFVQYLYSPKHGEEFAISRDSGTDTQTLENFCAIRYSDNLQQPEYRVFKQFLNQEVNCSEY